MTKRRGPNEGSLFQRADGRWVGVVNLGWENGRRRRKYYYGETYEEARKKLNGGISDRDRGVPLPDDRITVEQYLDEWVAGLNAEGPDGRKPSTISTYSAVIRHHITPNIGKTRLSKLTVRQVNDLLLKKRSELSPRRVQMIREVLRCVIHANRSAETPACRSGIPLMPIRSERSDAQVANR